MRARIRVVRRRTRPPGPAPPPTSGYGRRVEGDLSPCAPTGWGGWPGAGPPATTPLGAAPCRSAPDATDRARHAASGRARTADRPRVVAFSEREEGAAGPGRADAGPVVPSRARSCRAGPGHAEPAPVLRTSPDPADPHRPRTRPDRVDPPGPTRPGCGGGWPAAPGRGGRAWPRRGGPRRRRARRRARRPGRAPRARATAHR